MKLRPMLLSLISLVVIVFVGLYLFLTWPWDAIPRDVSQRPAYTRWSFIVRLEDGALARLLRGNDMSAARLLSDSDIRLPVRYAELNAVGDIVPVLPGPFENLRRGGKRIATGIRDGNLFRLTLEHPGFSLKHILNVLKNRPGIQNIQPDFLYHVDDGLQKSEYSSRSLTVLNGYQYQDLELELAWAIEAGTTDVVVGILDTGVYYLDPGLEDRIWINQAELLTEGIDQSLLDSDGDGVVQSTELLNYMRNAGMDFDGNGCIDLRDLIHGASPFTDNLDADGNGYIDDLLGWDFINGDNDPIDDRVSGNEFTKRYGHGTAVASIVANAAEVPESEDGLRTDGGVSWGAMVLPQKVISASGAGSSSAIIAAVDYAISNGVRVTNNSYGNFDKQRLGDDFLFAMIAAAGEAQQLFVASAGNDASDNDQVPYYPGAFDLDNIIVVAAHTEDGGLRPSSQYGRNTVDLAAPGDAYDPPGFYVNEAGEQVPSCQRHWGQVFGGTSAAAPFVSGVIALMLSSGMTHSGLPEDAAPVNGTDLTAQQIKNLLLNSVTPEDELRDRVVSGGRLNAFRSLNNLLYGMHHGFYTTPAQVSFEAPWFGSYPEFNVAVVQPFKFVSLSSEPRAIKTFTGQERQRPGGVFQTEFSDDGSIVRAPDFILQPGASQRIALRFTPDAPATSYTGWAEPRYYIGAGAVEDIWSTYPLTVLSATSDSSYTPRLRTTGPINSGNIYPDAPARITQAFDLINDFPVPITWNADTGALPEGVRIVDSEGSEITEGFVLAATTPDQPARRTIGLEIERALLARGSYDLELVFNNAQNQQLRIPLRFFIRGKFDPIRFKAQAVNIYEVAFLDYDDDGDLDVLETLPGQINIYENIDNEEFLRVTDAPEFVHPLIDHAIGGLRRIAVGDFNGDQLDDVFFAGDGSNALFRNNGNGDFERIDAPVFVGGPADIPEKSEWIDYDVDGDPDLFVTYSKNPVDAQSQGVDRLYRNLRVESGQPDFELVAAAGFSVPLSSRFSAWGDADNDGDPDLVVLYQTNSADSGTYGRLYRNSGGGASPVFEAIDFSSVLSEELAALKIGVQGTHATWHDYDQDGRNDLLVTVSQSVAGNNDVILLRNTGGSTLAFTPYSIGGLGGMVDLSAASSWGDYNDGDADILVANPFNSAAVYLENQSVESGGGPLTPPQFIVEPSVLGADAADGGFVHVIWRDVDGDGDRDLLVGVNQAGNILYINTAVHD